MRRLFLLALASAAVAVPSTAVAQAAHRPPRELTLTGATVVRRTADRVAVRTLPGAARVTMSAVPVASGAG